MKYFFVLIITIFTITLAACGANNLDSANDSNSGHNGGEHQGHDEGTSTEGSDTHNGMEHSASGEIPEGMKKAESPKYAVGSAVIIEKGHLPGMEGAEATVVGAYDTTVYRVSYEPVTGGARVENHEWVVHEELEEANAEPFKPGSEVTITAEHMEGMKGAVASVDTAEPMTVYVIDFTPDGSSEKVKNHLWVTEYELSPVQ